MSDLISKSALVDALTEQAKNTTKIAANAKGQAMDYYSGKANGLIRASIMANSALTIDAVPVVRCKDCFNYRPDKAGNYCRHFGRLRMDDFFCAYGERSEE